MISFTNILPVELDDPANLSARDETESSFMVSWDPVKAEIDGYMLTYDSSEGSSEEITLGSDTTSHMLTSLRPGVLYTVYVWAIKGSKASQKISTQAETGSLSSTFCLTMQPLNAMLISVIPLWRLLA